MIDGNDMVFLARLQFAFTVAFHIIFPSFTIGLASYLAMLEGLWLKTRRDVYLKLYRFWVKIFAVTFGMGVVSGIVLSYQFGTNWSELATRAGPIQGPLLAYESFTAFLLEATFFGVLLFGREKVPRVAYFVSTLMVALGTTFSAFWILTNNSWGSGGFSQALRDAIEASGDQEMLFVAAALAWVFRSIPAEGHMMLSLLVLGGIGFFLYGPHLLMGATIAMDLGSRKASATAGLGYGEALGQAARV